MLGYFVLLAQVANVFVFWCWMLYINPFLCISDDTHAEIFIQRTKRH